MAGSPTSNQPMGTEQAMVVLGCRVIEGSPSPALLRRLKRAGEIHGLFPDLPVIMSGGQTWDGDSESTVMCRWWRSQGHTTEHLLKEDASCTTKENAWEVAQLCRHLGYRELILVTCDFHMPRARRLFEAQDLAVTTAPAPFQRSAMENLRLSCREWGANLLGYWESNKR